MTTVVAPSSLLLRKCKQNTFMVVRTSAPGKIILFGEHSVVYDKLGIAGAINPRTDVRIEESDELKVILEDYGREQVISEEELSFILNGVEKIKRDEEYGILKSMSSDALLMSKAVISKASEHYNLRPFTIKIRSDIPMGGFGSGSAVFASTAAAIQLFFGRKIKERKVVDVANFGDIICHGGTPSGIDASTVTYGGYIEYKKSKGVKPLNIEQALPLVIGNTNIPAKTSMTVPHVRMLRESDPKKINFHLDEMHHIAEQGLDYIGDEDLEKVGQLMNENQKHLREIEVSHPKLEKLIRASLNAGALGAKLTGGGGGGIMIALCKNGADQNKIAKAITKSGGRPIITKLGANGVRREY